MVSDQEIAKGVETLLRQSDPNSITTFNGVVQQLQANLGLDLSDKTLFIRDQINLLLRPPAAHPQPHPVPVKEHFPLQNQPYFQNPHPQFHPHFAIQPQHHHHHQQLLLLQQQKQQQQHLHQPPPPPPPQQRTQELDFRVPQPQAKAPPAVAVKHEVAANVQNVASNSLESPKESAPAAAKRKGGPGGLNKVCGISPELQAVLGEPALPRTEIVKQLWAYIRKHNLQDPSNKRKIICDDALRVVFETDSTDMFKMNKLLSKHIIRLEPNKESKRTKVKAEAATGNSESAPPLVTISEALSNFLGTGERQMQQSEVLARVWEYIKVNHLEDPQHPVVIICDEKLKELLGCESISMMGISEMLTRHHILKR